MNMQGFEKVVTDTNAISGDRIVTPSNEVFDVLLDRDDHVIARSQSTKKKERIRRFYMANGVNGIVYRKIGVEAPIVVEETIKHVVKRVREGKTKLDVCRELFTANPTCAKPDMIQQFVSIGNCTAQGANTYYCLLKKQHQQ